MDDRRFDTATRVIGTLQTRRGALRGALGGIVGLAVAATADSVAAKPRKRAARPRAPRGNPCDVCDGNDCAFETIQAAIDAASAGASIAVCKGTYKENVDITTDVTLTGVGDVTIKGDGARSVVTVASGVTAVVDNVVITDGGGTLNPEIRVGGGVLVLGDLTLRGSIVEHNTAHNGGGIYVVGGGRLTLDATNVVENEAEAPTGQGGGIYNEPGSGLFVTNGSFIEENKALVGGGIRSGGVVEVSGQSSIKDNAAKLQGGGIMNIEGTVTLDNSQVILNDAENGGGIFNFTGRITLQNNAEVRGNTAKEDGGGIYLARNTFADITDSSVNENKAELGGGIFNFGGGVTLEGSTIFRNQASDTGGGIFNTEGGQVTLDADSAVRRNDPNNCVGTLACRG